MYERVELCEMAEMVFGAVGIDLHSSMTSLPAFYKQIGVKLPKNEKLNSYSLVLHREMELFLVQALFHEHNETIDS